MTVHSMSRRQFFLPLALAGGAFLRRGLSRAAAATEAAPELGPNADLGGRRVFPADNPWNVDVSAMPVDDNSAALIASIGLDKNLHPDFGSTYLGAPSGVPYVVVSGDQQRTVVRFEYGDESDDGYYPIPPDPPIEGGPRSTGDRHVLIVDRDHWKLYELYNAKPESGGRWSASSGAIFDLNSNQLRPSGWTSADAAGLPIFPGLVRHDEAVGRKVIPHALRFTCRRTRRGYVYPARHFASKSKDAGLPPMGMRVRLKADYDISRFPAPVQVILTALKKYGMFLADNGGDWFLTGAPHPQWNEEEVVTLKQVKGSAFEVVRLGHIVTQ